jgi:hypothetical protein
MALMRPMPSLGRHGENARQRQRNNETKQGGNFCATNRRA